MDKKHGLFGMPQDNMQGQQINDDDDEDDSFMSLAKARNAGFS